MQILRMSLERGKEHKQPNQPVTSTPIRNMDVAERLSLDPCVPTGRQLSDILGAVLNESTDF